MDKIATVFGKVLRAARTEAGLTQEQLGLAANIQRKYVSELELGQKAPSLETVIKIAGAVGVTPSELVMLVVSALPVTDE